MRLKDKVAIITGGARGIGDADRWRLVCLVTFGLCTAQRHDIISPPALGRTFPRCLVNMDKEPDDEKARCCRICNCTICSAACRLRDA
jgi:hypothetical protein